MERAATLLEALAEAGGTGGGAGISALASRTGLPYATVHRLLTALTACGYARQEPDSRKYVLGPALIRLGMEARRTYGWWAQPYLEKLAEFSGETANLAILDGDDIVYVGQAQGRALVRMFTEVGNRVPAHTTAVGKVLLGYRANAEIESLARRRGLIAKTPHTIVMTDRLVREVEAARKAGYAMDDEEAELGVRCIAVPVVGGGNRKVTAPSAAMAAISISAPAGRLSAARRRAILPEMTRIAAEMASEGARSSSAVP